MTRLVLFELFVTNLLLFEHQQKNLLVSWQFSGPYDVTKYGSGWRKDVVMQRWTLSHQLCVLFQLCPGLRSAGRQTLVATEADEGGGMEPAYCLVFPLTGLLHDCFMVSCLWLVVFRLGCLTPSLPQHVKFTGWKMLIYFQCYAFWWEKKIK